MRAFVSALSLALTAVFCWAGAAQAAIVPIPGIQWVRTLGSGTGRCVEQTLDGGYLLTGWTKGQPGAGSAIFLIKTDEQGHKSWETLLPGNGFSCGYGVSQTGDGGAVVVGDTKSKTGYDHDVFVARVDGKGNVIWEKNFGGPHCDYGAAVIPTADGGCLVAGGTESYGAGIYDAYLIRLNGQGQELWSKTYGGRGSDCGYALLQTPDGGYAVAGDTDSTSSGKTNVYLFKTDSEGNLLWSKAYGGMKDSYGWSLQQTGAGGYIIAGETEMTGAGGGGFQSYLVETDALGNQIRDSIYGGESYSTTHAVWQTGDGNYLLAGKKEIAGGTHYLHILKTGGSGSLVWEKALAGLGDSCAFAGQPTRDGGSIIAGEKGPAAGGRQQIMLLKLAPDRSAALMAQSITVIVIIPLLILLAHIKRRNII